MTKKKTPEMTINFDSIQHFVSPLIQRLVRDYYDLGQADESERKAIQDVSSSNGNKLLCVSHWSGSGKSWCMCSIENNDKSLESTTREMISASANPKDAYWVHIFDSLGNCWQLEGETVKVNYSLVEM